jgi:hypothetical protein
MVVPIYEITLYQEQKDNMKFRRRENLIPHLYTLTNQYRTTESQAMFTAAIVITSHLESL